jgi:hypothetical protein
VSEIQQQVALQAKEAAHNHLPLSLAEAVVMGDLLKIPGRHLLRREPDGQLSGCALSGALLAAGVSAHQIIKEAEELSGELDNLPSVRRLWPFLRGERLHTLCHAYGEVLEGRKPIEFLGTYANAIETAATFEKNTPSQVISRPDNSALHVNLPPLTDQEHLQRHGFTRASRDNIMREVPKPDPLAAVRQSMTQALPEMQRASRERLHIKVTRWEQQ